MAPKIDVNIPDWKYACTDCGQCCKRWHVELSADEVRRLDSLDWPVGAELPKTRTIRMKGNTYIAHRVDRTCIYYDQDKKNCMIHSQFGMDKKPLGCKIYPFSVAPTFDTTVSLIGRFDCPAVRGKEGKEMRTYAGDARTIAAALGIKKGFDHLDLDGLAPVKAQDIVQNIVANIFDNEDIPPIDKIVIASTAAARIENLGAVFINEMDMGEIFPSFFERTISDRKFANARRLGGIEQARFISLLSSFLRRDEDAMAKGAKGRFGQFAGLLRMLSSKANLHDIGEEHPDFAMSRKLFFGVPIENPESLDLELLFDFMKVRLTSYQFFGATVYNRSFFFGLQSLFLLMALILGLAKWSALVRDQKICQITAEDLDYAVGAIDHAYGRSAFLGIGFMNTLQRQVGEPSAFERVVEELVNPE